MLIPSRTKFRKEQKGRIGKIAQRGYTLAFGDWGIKALEPGWITSRQIEAARTSLSKAMKRMGLIWIRIFPQKPITQKPAEVRMGKGKGSVAFYVAVVKPGTILFEVGGVSETIVKKAMRLASKKLPIKTKVAVRNDYVT